MTLPAGTRISTYEIVEPLGVGGMGEVYRAIDTRLSRDVALKVLPPELARDGDRMARFEREAQTASGLNHPNIVTIYEIGESDGTPFIAMERVEGKTLRVFAGGAAIPIRRLLSIAAQVADGLAKAHAAGIVHRDLKPENLMVTRDGFVKILDFGLAKLARRGLEPSGSRDRATVTRATHAGAILGTAGYMSPEQASGEAVDFRSDQFSLGAILYELIAGAPAFDRPTDAQTLSAIIEAEPEPLTAHAPKTPAALISIVERCLAKDPEERYGSTKDLARDLAAIRDLSSGTSASLTAPPGSRRLRLSRAAAAGAVLGAAGLAVVTFLAGQRLQVRRSRDEPPPKRTTLTFRRGYVTGARFAPDGQTIVYSAAWDGKTSEIFTTRIGSTDSRALGLSGATLLAVSSRGEMAISIDCARPWVPCTGVLARVPLAGGAPRETLTDVSSADWSPDGRELAVSRLGRLEYPIGKVLYKTDKVGFLTSVRVSPDGSHVAFVENPGGEDDTGILSVVDRAGRRRVLTTERVRLAPILWSPAGDEVFFSRADGSERRGVRLSGGTRSASWILGLDDVSREGRFLDTGTLSEDFRGVILARVPESTEERNLAWLRSSVAVDLAPDGSMLLLYDQGPPSDQPGREVFTTFLRPTDGSDPVILGEGRALALSPDGQLALVARFLPEAHLVLLPVGAGDPRELPGRGLRYRRALFSSDGKRIVFTAEDDRGSLNSYVQDLAAGPPRQIGEAGFRAAVPSPDGRSVVGRTERGVFQLRIDVEEPPRPVAGSLLNDVPVQWSADGKAIYVWATDTEPPLTVDRIELETGRRERWRRLAPPDMTGFLRYGPRFRGPGLAITPDGRFYAYTYFIDQSRLVLSEGARNWWR
jgi:Tol biopolymer transport system component